MPYRRACLVTFLLVAWSLVPSPAASADRSKAAPQSPIQVGKEYVLLVPDGTCNACPYRGTAVSLGADGWVEIRFEKAAPRLWHSVPEVPGEAPIRTFWVNTRSVIAVAPAPPAPVESPKP